MPIHRPAEPLDRGPSVGMVVAVAVTQVAAVVVLFVIGHAVLAGAVVAAGAVNLWFNMQALRAWRARR